MEKQQEAMLRSKYPQLNRAPGGGSALLHKRLHKGVSSIAMIPFFLNFADSHLLYLDFTTI